MPLELYPRGDVWWVRGRPADGDEYVRKSLGTSDQALAEAAVRELEAAARKRRILGPDAPKPQDEMTFAAAAMIYPASPRDAGYLARLVRRERKTLIRDMTPTYVLQIGPKMMPAASTDTWHRQIVTPIRSVINNAHALGKCPPIRIRAYTEAEMVRQDQARGRQSRVRKTPGSWPWVLAFCAAADPRDAALAYFMFRHGYRVGRSVASTRSRDLDLSAGRIRVHASKGHPAHWVDLDPEEVAMIANLRRPREAAAGDRVFRISSSTNGGLRKRWQTACRRAGIEYLPPHAAGRHGYGTEMVVRQGVDPVNAADGKWSDPGVMLRTYAHPEDSVSVVRAAMAAGRAAARKAG